MKEIVKPMSKEEAVEIVTKFLEENSSLSLCDKPAEEAVAETGFEEEIPFVENLPPGTPPRVYIV